MVESCDWMSSRGLEVGGKSEWWRVVISWEENVSGEVVIFWDGGSMSLIKLP